MPGCVCWGSENVPIMNDALGKKTKHNLLKGSYPDYGVILSKDVSLTKVFHSPLLFKSFTMILVDCSSCSL